jgi:hypothetical protein
MRYESYPSSPQSEPDPYARAAPVERVPSTADLASDLEAELMRELQASFNAVRAPIEPLKQPEIPSANFDEMDFDAFAEVHYRRHAPMEAAPPPPQPKTGIESLATWREPTRPRPRQAGPSFRQRLADSAAESSAPLRTAAEIRYEPDPLAADPEIAAVAAAAESFSNASPERAQPPRSAYDHSADDSYTYVPGYGPPADGAHDHDEDEEYEVRRSPGSRPLILVGGLFAVVLIGAIGFFAVTSFLGGDSGPPPLIMADTGPIKVRPEDPGGAASSDQNKLIYDRVGGGDTADAELAPDHSVTTVSRPEAQQTEASREISRIILPNPTDPPVENEPAGASAESGAVGPKRVRTVVVRPDGTIVSSTSTPAAAPPQSSAPVESAAIAAAEPAPRAAEPAPAAREPIARAVSDEPAMADEPDDLGFADDWEAENPLPADDEPVGTTEPPTAAAAPAEKTGPISLLPKSGGSTAEPARVASVEPAAKKPVTEKPVVEKTVAAAAAATGSYFVQVSSQRSETAALAAYREVQRRFPSVLADRDADIQRADLGSRGVYYRARVAPGLSGSEAVSLCTSLKNAGGDCIITQN